MSASEAAFMQPEDIIRLHANLIQGVLGTYRHGVIIPMNEPIVMGIPIHNFELALIDLKRRGLIKIKVIIDNSRAVWFIQLSNTTKHHRE